MTTHVAVVPRILAPRWTRDAAILAASLVAGALFGQLFRWPEPSVPPQLGLVDIASHNLALAALALVGTRYVAMPMMVVSSWVLGIGIAASLAVSGALTTAALTLPHVPLEMLAWLLTLRLSGLLWPWLIATARHLPCDTSSGRIIRLSLVTFAAYVLAAACEALEIVLHWTA